MALFREQADVSVRPAVVGDEHALGRIQVAAWRTAHVRTLGTDVLDALDEDAFAQRWATAITTPPGAGFHVLVACRGAEVVGFASVAPVPPPHDAPLQAPGAVLLALEVAPDQQRAGHGSRLLAAAVDMMRADGADQVHTWVLDGDDGRAAFLAGAGLGDEGVAREVASGTRDDGTSVRVDEHRWSAQI